ncbi:MAG: ribosome maturation factor RimP [Atopostipes suicloacalis]|nr:ribosome maturation factor RimP [Atopostipes suicloacalis]MDN6730761.1 ribosome maturation factor RimP [Atopostipes suicloacalis]
MNIVEIVSEIAEPIAKENEFQIVDIEYLKEGKNWFLRIYIDKQGGVDLNDCARFNQLVSEKLDTIEPDPIPYAYYLEVSSPGAERPLKSKEDFEDALDQFINLSLYNPVEGRSSYEGRLDKLTNKKATLIVKDKMKEKEIEIQRDNISKARLAIEF